MHQAQPLVAEDARTARSLRSRGTRRQRGSDRSSLQQANLVPPGLLAGEPGAHLPYLVMRENVINRVFHQTVGYWQPDLQGMDILGRSDRGTGSSG